jgi:hypothetical protein
MAYIPSYSNPTPIFEPAMRVIAGITNANPLQVTTNIDHDYQSGLIVRLDIPFALGMQQVDQVIASIMVTGATTFTMPIDSTTFDTFSVPAAFPPGYQDAQVVPVGNVNSSIYLATQNVLP